MDCWWQIAEPLSGTASQFRTLAAAELMWQVRHRAQRSTAQDAEQRIVLATLNGHRATAPEPPLRAEAPARP